MFSEKDEQKTFQCKSNRFDQFFAFKTIVPYLASQAGYEWLSCKILPESGRILQDDVSSCKILPESCKILQDNHFLQESCKIAIRSARILVRLPKITVRFARILQDNRLQKKFSYT